MSTFSYKKFSEKEKDKIVNLYEGGMTSQGLGERFGVSYKTIVKILRERGAEIRGKVFTC